LTMLLATDPPAGEAGYTDDININSNPIKHQVRVLWSREKIQQSGPVEFLNYGHSMKPLICEGDLVTVLPSKHSYLRIGDIILAQSTRLSTGLIMHRVITKRYQNDNSYLITQGDANPYPDPPIYPEDILGRVLSIKRDDKIIRIDRGLYYGLGWFLGHFAFLTRWINKSGLRKYIRKVLHVMH